MKKPLSVLLAALLLFSLAACGGTQDSGSSAATPSASERTTSSEASDTSTSTSISQQPTSSTSTTRKSVPTKGVTTTVTTTTTTAQQKIILCRGDSLTEGMGMESGTGTKYPDALQNLLGSGYKVWNGGYSGDTSLAIMTRQGAIKLTTKDAITFKAGESTVKLGLRREGFGFLMDDGNELSRMNIEVGTEDMKAVGVTPTDTDIGMLSKNQIPQSLRYKNNPGDVHLNKYGYKLIAQCLHERGRQLGYWK